MVLSQAAGGPALSGRGADVDVAIVGAGPHGLSAAVHLRRAGVRAHVLGEPLSFWKSMPEGMKLRSNLRASNLIEYRGPFSLRRYSAVCGRAVEPPLALADFIDYGDWVAQAAVPGVDRRQLARLERDRSGFVLALSDGQQLRARRVVLACGIAAFEREPADFAHLPPALVSHSARHRDVSGLARRRVTIVGGGQSALELAALISEAGAADVEVLVRADRVVWLRGHAVIHRLGPLGPVLYAPTDVGPLWYSRLVERPALLACVPRSARDRIAARCIRPACSHFVRVRLGGVRVTTGVSVAAADAAGETLHLSLSDGSRREADHLVLATGYRVDFSRYAFLAPSVTRAVRVVDGYPVLGPGLQTSLAGLHVMGAPAAWSFGPIMRFVSGSWYAGRALARMLAPRRAALPFP